MSLCVSPNHVFYNPYLWRPALPLLARISVTSLVISFLTQAGQAHRSGQWKLDRY